ncbi:MAG: hypothetical protein GY930_03480 [bacterium]|nr:hypothetical protein [bacterium]
MNQITAAMGEMVGVTQSNAAAAEQAAATTVDLCSMVDRVAGLVGNLQTLIDDDRVAQK